MIQTITKIKKVFNRYSAKKKIKIVVLKNRYFSLKFSKISNFLQEASDDMFLF